MRSVIIGGGVGGCAMAAALRGSAVGREVAILERRAVGAAGGMGFILMPNGVDALERIAPEIAWRSSGRTIDRVALRAACGRELSSHAIDPALCVSRERFLGLLRQAAGGARFIEGATVTGLTHRAEAGAGERGSGDGPDLAADTFTSVTYTGDQGVEQLAGDAFFGCDGAASRTRALVFPEAQLAEVVVKEIVSVAHAPALAKRLGSTFHKFHDEEGGLAVGVLAESDERVVWFTSSTAGAGRASRRRPRAWRALWSSGSQAGRTRSRRRAPPPTSGAAISGRRGTCRRWRRWRGATWRWSAMRRTRACRSPARVPTARWPMRRCCRSCWPRCAIRARCGPRSSGTAPCAVRITGGCSWRDDGCARRSWRRCVTGRRWFRWWIEAGDAARVNRSGRGSAGESRNPYCACPASFLRPS